MYWQFRPGAGSQPAISCSQVSIVQHHNNSTSIKKMILQSFLVDCETCISHVTWMMPLNTCFSKGRDAHVTIHHCKVQQQVSVTYPSTRFYKLYKSINHNPHQNVSSILKSIWVSLFTSKQTSASIHPPFSTCHPYKTPRLQRAMTIASCNKSQAFCKGS